MKLLTLKNFSAMTVSDSQAVSTQSAHRLATRFQWMACRKQVYKITHPNRLLRQYLHKNADLGSFTQDHLDSVAAKLNHRPRRVLGWTTPAEAFGTAQPRPMPLTPA